MNFNFDIAIIGSGLLSAKIALVLAKQGLKVCLLSEKDFGYFNKFNKIDIANDTDISYKNASNNFIPINLINVDFEKSSVKKLYKQILSKTPLTKEQFKNNKDLSGIEPQLNNPNIEYATLKKVYKYDYARVCIDIVLTAQEYGAEIYNYVKNIEIAENKVLFNSKIINTKLIIDLRIKPKKVTAKHFTIPRHKLEITNSLQINSNNYFIQVIPYFSVVFVKINNELSINNALEKINSVFNKKILEKEILDSWNNYVCDSDINVSENIINTCDSYNIDNNKLAEIISIISIKLNISKPTDYNIELHNNFTFEKQKNIIYDQVDKTFREVQQINISPNEFTKLYYRYGSKFDIVIDKVYDFYRNKEKRNNAWLIGELWYAKNYEMTVTANDFIFRRTNTYFSNYFDEALIHSIRKIFDSI